MQAVLCSRNRPLMELELNSSGYAEKITDIYDTKHMPVIFMHHADLAGVNQWLRKRRIPPSREGLAHARERFPGFDALGHMFSLSDQYWFRFRPEETWEAGNCFTNRYAEDVGRIFFLPWTVNPASIDLRSPDLTTNGVLRKRWVQDETGLSHLVKAGSKKYHQEPLSEVLTSLVLEKLDLLPFVPYHLVVDGLRLCSSCPNFITKDTEFVPAFHVYSLRPRKGAETVYDHLIAMCDMLGIAGAKRYLDSMIAVDTIIGNDDRHLGNFGFIRDVHSGRITGFAPLFDSGSAFGCKGAAMKPNRLFKDREEEALKEAAEWTDLSVLADCGDLMTLVSRYPDITPAKKEVVRRGIRATERTAERATERGRPRKEAVRLNGRKKTRRERDRKKERGGEAR